MEGLNLVILQVLFTRAKFSNFAGLKQIILRINKLLHRYSSRILSINFGTTPNPWRSLLLNVQVEIIQYVVEINWLSSIWLETVPVKVLNSAPQATLNISVTLFLPSLKFLSNGILKVTMKPCCSYRHTVIDCDFE